jgi:23S rRNA pseudouridine2604 synthase
MRLNHYISASGYTSRRDADRLIEAGKVTVNGSVAALGTQVFEDDIVEIEGKRILKQEAFVYLVLNKPVGITCTTDREIEGNIVDFINYPQRIFHVGRLDKDSEGLILMTNNGDIVNEILRSHNKNEKDYEVSVNKTITEEFIAKMAAGVEIFNPVKKQYTVTDPCKITKTGKRTFNITLSQGLNRQIRNMCKKLGYRVVKLKRVRIMNIKLGSLPVGQWRHLTQQELTEMMAQLNRNKKTQN